MNSKTLYIFPFVKYIKPTWYFNLLPVNYDYSLWINYDLLSDKEKSLIDFDDAYSSREASLRDAAYQANQKGIMEAGKELELEIKDEVSLEDNYRFIRKYFNTHWALLIFFIRLVSFHNPVKEFLAYKKTRNVKRVNVYTLVREYGTGSSSENDEVQPLVSVIIPTLNRYQYLDDVLKDLEKQTYKNFEVIICDQTDVINEEFYENRDLNIRLIKQKEKALWLARNRSIKESKGDYILLFDDDSRVNPDWIGQHLRCIEYFQCDISSGVSISVTGAKVPENYSFYRWGDQLDTGNVMIKKDVFRKVGLFDRQFEKQRMGDGEFGLRCYLAGLLNVSNPKAQRLHLKVSTGGLRQMGSWDGFRPKKLFAPRPIPSVLYLTRKYFGTSAAKQLLLLSVPPSLIPYKYKSSKLLTAFSFIMVIFISPIVFIQVMMSWKKASKMLKEGEKIEFPDE